MHLGVQQAQIAAVIELADRQLRQLKGIGFVCLTGGGAEALRAADSDAWSDRFSMFIIVEDLVHFGLKAAFEAWRRNP